MKKLIQFSRCSERILLVSCSLCGYHLFLIYLLIYLVPLGRQVGSLEVWKSKRLQDFLDFQLACPEAPKILANKLTNKLGSPIRRGLVF